MKRSHKQVRAVSLLLPGLWNLGTQQFPSACPGAILTSAALFQAPPNPGPPPPLPSHPFALSLCPQVPRTCRLLLRCRRCGPVEAGGCLQSGRRASAPACCVWPGAPTPDWRLKTASRGKLSHSVITCLLKKMPARTGWLWGEDTACWASLLAMPQPPLSNCHGRSPTRMTIPQPTSGRRVPVPGQVTDSLFVPWLSPLMCDSQG